MLKQVIGMTALAAIAAPAMAMTPLVTILDEDFESYLGEADPQAAIDAVWGPGELSGTFYQFYSAPGNEFNYPTNAVTVNNTPGGSASIGFGASPAGGAGSKVLFADIPGLDEAYHNYVPTDENPLFVSFDIFDSGQGNIRRTLGLRQGGGSANITEIGYYNGVPSNDADITERFKTFMVRQILWDDAGFGSSGPNYVAFDLTTENLDDEGNPIFIQIEDPENPGEFIDSDDSSIPNGPAFNFIPDGEPGVWHTFTATIGATEQVFTMDYLADGVVDAEMILTGNAPSEEGFGEVRIGGPSFISSTGDPVYWDNILIQVLEGDEPGVPGDANGDGVVNLLDLSILASNFDGTDTPYGVEDGDFNDDGFVNLLDLSILASNFETTPAPEPAVAGILGLGALGLIRRR
ncbi:dockerin type I domain-containing protein [Mucisphaera calidilacus]|uniref:Dockerin domain-containing protein n=1 Tax=Mucisphaera calidilacus TaxID=2527982 RepID=A0A518BW22_9BACT|nr:dockerin type I domain-containing protein [Mucisphaera calidilacus]QDU71183.1 hypothetical protein Pan265_10320 [Mucisphaera calidilacus]